MRWPWSGDDSDKKKASLAAWIESSKSTEWSSAFTDPRTVGTSLVLTASTVAALRFYKSYLRRIPSVNHIKPESFRRRSLFGQVTSVGDADNFRLFHTPGGRIAGWGWLPWKRVPTTKKGGLANNTVSFSGPLVLLSLQFRRYTFGSLASTPQNWHIGGEKRSRIPKKRSIGSRHTYTTGVFACTSSGAISTRGWWLRCTCGNGFGRRMSVWRC